MKHKKTVWVKPSSITKEYYKHIMKAVVREVENMEDFPEEIILKQIFTPQSVRQTYVEMPTQYPIELVKAFDLFSDLNKAIITISVNPKTKEIIWYKQEIYKNY